MDWLIRLMSERVGFLHKISKLVKLIAIDPTSALTVLLLRNIQSETPRGYPLA